MLREKARNFILINMISKPVLMILGLLSSIFVVRRLGADQYASIVVLQALKGTISMLMGLGMSATLTKLWVKYDRPEKKKGLLFTAFTVQIGLIVIMLISRYFIPDIASKIFGKFIIGSIPIWGVSVIFFSAILSTIFSSVLIAELNNKVLFATSSLSSLSISIWLLTASYLKMDITKLNSGIIIIWLFTSLLLSLTALKSFKSLNLSFKVPDKALLKDFFSFFSVISFASVFKYLTGLNFISILLSNFGMITELAYLAIVFKVVGSLQGIIGIPINKLTGVLFANAFKRNDKKMMNTVYNFVARYYLLSFGLTVSLLFFSGERLIKLFYHINPINYVFQLFLISVFANMITSIDNWIASIYEHYWIFFAENIFSIIILLTGYFLFVKNSGIIAVVICIFISRLIHNLIAMIFVKKKYNCIIYPRNMFFSVIFSMLLSIIIIFKFPKNIIITSLVPIIIFTISFLLLYRFDKTDKKMFALITELLPKKQAQS